MSSRIVLHGAFLLLLLVAVCCLPLPLYLVVLAVFGLPHVVWEMAFLRSRYAGCGSRRWWQALALILLIQASVRFAAWLGLAHAWFSQFVDLIALFVMALIVLFAPRGAGWRVRTGGLLLAGIALWMLEQGDYLSALLLLGVVHNFTPLAFVWDMARIDLRFKPLARYVSLLFVLPLLVAASGWVAPVSFASAQQSLLEGQLPSALGGTYRPALLSAMVLAQCLHYYCVIYLLPRAEVQRTGNTVIAPSLKYITLAVVSAMLIYFLVNYSAARQLYSVAAGVHAWLEWPVLLMMLQVVR
jgi:hypothetical protein